MGNLIPYTISFFAYLVHPKMVEVNGIEPMTS